MLLSRSMPFSFGTISITLCLAWGLVGVARADMDPDFAERREVGIGLAREGRCERALVQLSAVQGSTSTDAEVARLMGECRIRLQQFDLAVPALESARELDPEAPKVDLHLAIAYFHLGELDRAEGALLRAQARDSEEAEFLLYAGLISLSRADYEHAIHRLEAASQLRDRPVEPMASFFLGRAFRHNKERKEAESAFSRVIRDAPGTAWAEEAQRAIDALNEESEIKVWALLEVGFEQDDNALLLGRGVARPQEISGQSDQRGFWFVDVGALLLRTETWNGGAGLRYGGLEHAELSDFDAQAAGGTVWLDRELGVWDSTLRIEANFDATWIDSDPFLYSHSWKALIHKPWESGAYTLVSVAVGIDDYRYETVDVRDVLPSGLCFNPNAPCGPAGLNEANATDRDGTGVLATLLHRAPLPIESDWIGQPWIEGEYQYSRYASEGSEYDQERHQIEIGFGAELPFEIQFTIAGRYAYSPYGNASTFPDPSDLIDNQEYFLDNSRRREQETGIRVRLERAFGEHVVVSTRWSRTRNRSTADVFDYTRDLFGVSVRIGFGN